MGAPVPGAGPLPREEVRRIVGGNLADEFERLRGTPGFQLDPVPWEAARGFVDAGTAESLGHLGRHPAAVHSYWRFRDKACADLPLTVGYSQLEGCSVGSLAGSQVNTLRGNQRGS